MNRSDVRLGMAFYERNPEIRVINGVRRGEDMQPLLIRPVGDLPDRLAGFELVPADSMDLLEALTPTQHRYWSALSAEFSFEQAAGNLVPRSSLFRLIQKTTSLGVLRKDESVYRKVPVPARP
jgi:hypothetical protein